MTAGPIARLDHAVVAVRNLDTAASGWRRFGFTLTPRGLHEGKGTGNNCIMFARNYVELLGVVDEAGAQGRLAARVASRGEGGMALAWGADDADATCAALRAAGIAAEDPNDLSRPLDLDGQRAMVSFRNVMMPDPKWPGVMQFVCTHLTPHLTRARHEWQLHPNGATSLARVIVAHPAPGEAEAEAGTLFGTGRRDGRLDNTDIVIRTRAAVAAEFGPSLLEGAPEDGIVGFVFRVNEVDAVAAMLDMGRIPHREAAGRVYVPAASANGVFLVFAED